MSKFHLALVPVVAMLALAGCSNNLYADVTRFHTNQPISRGTLAIVPADPSMANSLEFRTHAETVAVGHRARLLGPQRLAHQRMARRADDRVQVDRFTQVGNESAHGGLAVMAINASSAKAAAT